MPSVNVNDTVIIIVLLLDFLVRLLFNFVVCSTLTPIGLSQLPYYKPKWPFPYAMSSLDGILLPVLFFFILSQKPIEFQKVIQAQRRQRNSNVWPIHYIRAFSMHI